ncbi:threonine/serine exporter family protein [Nesterenkonia pannonica]|uniref:threonine/serine exporter family protein n=1 Tax=Nesterenkonia pannonica TaxID=1548602 RepID=UPI002164AA24|nr:threonine/serine exporter family protein [Nesterenkonia pannonica]
MSPQHVFNRLMKPERLATRQTSIVDRLTGTPYEHVQRSPQSQHTELPVQADELETISFVLDLGETLFRYGAGALEVETSIIAATAAFGMKNTEVDITNQSISLNWAPGARSPTPGCAWCGRGPRTSTRSPPCTGWSRTSPPAA